ncbi:GNAT family N-acetyltransferase [bacterium]|nr:GNAT family N-acetyltransferase [bacterium]
MNSEALYAIEPVRILHVDAIREIAAQSFPLLWSEKEFAYFLCHEHRLALGYFTPSATGPRLRGYFLALLVQGDLDIISIATAPSDRRLGIGSTLLQAALKSPGVDRAFLEVEVDNTAAIGLYASNGFERLGRRPAYYGPGRDAFLMRWGRELSR